jgi:hypothetical protein
MSEAKKKAGKKTAKKSAKKKAATKQNDRIISSTRKGGVVMEPGKEASNG